ncbi:MAG: molybdopterin molybdotransferase MoeA [Erythrobacter sp.]|nr:molybdopterin molybdotransferase MoeA [Erythrobacter sp.]
MSGLLLLEEAQARLLAAVEPLGAEVLPVAQAVGRYLAQPVLARRTQPAADLSAMDGYAMRADDLAGPWQVVGESAAGHPYAGELAPGHAIRMSTGALMPQGGGAVLLQENARREGDRLSLANADGPTPRHVRRAGFDFAEGQALLAAGQRIEAPQVALALMAGHEAVAVGRLPSLAVIDSGDELASPGGPVASHQIPASNGPMIEALCRPLVAQSHRIGPVADRLEALVQAFDAAGDADVVVTSGGASVGDHDLVRPALERWGATIDFWKVAIKPGKPLLVARKGRQLVIGLPGNPVSSYVTAYLFLLPVLRRLAGAATPLPLSAPMKLLAPLPATGGRAEFDRATLEPLGVLPIAQTDSSALLALSRAQALIYRPAHAPVLHAGAVVPVYLLQNGGMA